MSSSQYAPGTAPYERLHATGLRFFTPLFDYLYCMLASIVLVRQPLLGGALFMVAQIAELAGTLLHPDSVRHLTKGVRLWGYALTMLSALIAFALLLIYPASVNMPKLWLLFSLVLLIMLRSLAARRLCGSMQRRQLSRVQRAFRLTELMLLFCLILSPVLFLSQATDTAWYLLGGFAFSSFIESYALFASKEQAASPKEDTGEPADENALKQANSYRSFRHISIITVTALQVTMILSYTFIGTTAGGLLTCMGLAFVCIYLSSRLTRQILLSPRHARHDPSNVLLSGLTLWLAGLVLLSQNIMRGEHIWAYIALALCTCGTTLAAAALQALDGNMKSIIAFVTGRDPDTTPESMNGAEYAFATLVGQMFALLGLSLLLIFGGYPAKGFSVPSLQPTLLIPALLLVAAALLAAFRFPLENRYTVKLERFLMLREDGETNIPLQKQLEDVLVKVKRRRYGIKLLIRFLRLLFPTKVEGRENVKLDKDIPCVFTCNHGELYGPIIANIYIPFPFRSWMISEMVNHEQIATYIYTWTIKRQRWLPEKWKWPVARCIVGPALTWIVNSLDHVPVYRNSTKELIHTFKLSAEALEAEDNLLIFPENPNDPAQEKPGYLRDTVGAFFTGFTTVAQLYHKRMGKCPQFYPLYADKKRHTLTFGPPIRYDPNNAPVDEQRRIAHYLRGEMLRMGGLEAQPDDA